MKLKRVTITVLLNFAIASFGIAQITDNTSVTYVRPANEQQSTPSNSVISLGVGMGGNYPYIGPGYEQTPNLTLSYENVVLKNVGPGDINLGGLFSYKSVSNDYTGYYTGYNYDQHWNYYILGARLSYKIYPFNNKKIEMYAGAIAGYYIAKFKFTSNDPNYSNPDDPGYPLNSNNNYPNYMALSVFAGIRSWVTPHSSVWIEAGYGYTSLNFGASYRI